MNPGTRVHKHTDKTKTGMIIEAINDHRYKVKWDDNTEETWNKPYLREIPAATPSTFCCYCLHPFEKVKGPTDVVINRDNGQAFHVHCAKRVSDTYAVHVAKPAPPTDLALYTRYVGTLTLLGRLVRRERLKEDEVPFDRCFADANGFLEASGSTLRFVKGINGWTPLMGAVK